MKICFLTYTVFSIGGIQRVVSIIANELTAMHEVDIVCTSDKFPMDCSLYDLNELVNVKIEKSLEDVNLIKKIFFKLLKILNMKTGIFNNKILIEILKVIYYPKEKQKKFIKYLNNQNYDIVIGVAGEYSILLGIISDKLYAKTIGWQHNSYDAYLKTKERYFWNQDELFNRYISKLDIYLVLTDYDQQMFLERNNIKSIVIPNPRSFYSSIKSDVNSKQFLAAGRFTYQKGFDLLIESFLKFSKENNDWNLVIVGEGSEREKIEELVKKYNLNNRIRIENFTDNIKEYFISSSVLLLSSRWEGMPMIALESLEMGVPIISYDITAIQSIVENLKQGLIVKRNDVEGFAKAMLKVANSVEQRKFMSTQAIIKSEEFTINKIGVKWNQILKNLD